MRVSSKATIARASGYAGGKVARLLAVHLEIEIITLIAASDADRLLSELHPWVDSLAELWIQETSVGTLSGHDFVILALLHGYSTMFAEELDANGDGALVLDCAADHRLIKAEDWTEYYGEEFSPAWTYDMPELTHVRESLVRA